MKKKESLRGDDPTLQEKINFLLERKLEEIYCRTGEELDGKDIEVLIKLANLQDKLGGRPILAASITVIEELLIFLEECDEELKQQLGEYLPEFFAHMRDNYE